MKASEIKPGMVFSIRASGSAGCRLLAEVVREFTEFPSDEPCFLLRPIGTQWERGPDGRGVRTRAGYSVFAHPYIMTARKMSRVEGLDGPT